MGFLQISLDTPRYLKFNVYLSDEPGALFKFLDHTSSVGANIAFLDHDVRAKDPGRLTIGLTLENDSVANKLLENLRSNYRIEILEFDSTGKKLDDTVFYLRFAQEIRDIIGNAEDDFLMRLLGDSNHIAQELTGLGKDPRMVFDSIIMTGRTLHLTAGPGFFADVQRFKLENGSELYCFQLPCGGSVYIINSPEELVMIDTGYGIYHHDVMDMLRDHGLDPKKLGRIYVTHADADHLGSAGLFEAKCYLHQGSVDVIQESNRAYGSRMEDSILGQVYTTLIDLFSKFDPPVNIETYGSETLGTHGILPVIAEMDIAGLHFQVLESLGGHLHGHVFFLCQEEGLLFTGDCLMNFESLKGQREEYNTLAKNLMTTVNVDSEKASQERKALLLLIEEMNKELMARGKKCLICGGHGAVSFMMDGHMEVASPIIRYRPLDGPPTK